MKAWPLLGILLVEAFLFGAHWFVYRTLVDFETGFRGGLDPAGSPGLRTLVIVLAFSFMAAALLSFRSSALPVRLFYRLAALWLGFLNFFFWASCLCWAVWFALRPLRLNAHPAAIRPLIANCLFCAAIAAGVYGVLNALWIRVRRLGVNLPGLPEAWRGRRAVLLSDLHLGAINGPGFCRRVARMAARLDPDIVFLPGDLFDGTKADLSRVTAPLKSLTPRFGIFFSTGNHEEFTSSAHYLEAAATAGLRNLANELVDVDGLQVAGVEYSHSTYPIRIKAALEAMRLDRGRASVLLNHAPTRLPIVEQAGFSLQLSGHTHGGQIFPFTWLTRRVFGRFTYGLHRFGKLQVYTSSGAGTWGPPMRVGTHPEIVLMTFE
ncbi:MAG: metallophosphoesterase [Terracidiphilus sp.]